MLHAVCRTCKKAPHLGAFLLCALLGSPQLAVGTQACSADRIDEWATVQTIYDGDTIRLHDQRIVRFIAVNTPERARDAQPAEPFAEEATRSLRRLAPEGSRVGLRFDAERYDRHRRTLAHVFTDEGINLSAALIEQGEGFAIAIAPNTWQVECYFRRELAAREARRGIWLQPYYAPRPVTNLSSQDSGFMRIRGRVTHTGKSRKNVWLDLGSQIALKIPLTRLEQFSVQSPESLLGRDIIARGWVNFYNHKLRMTVSHPAMLEIME